MAKELVRSGNETDLASYVEGQMGNKFSNNSYSQSNSNQEIVLIGRSVGTVHKKELLKNIGELEDEEFMGDGDASGESSKQMILGSVTSMPFDKALDESSNSYSPISQRMTKAQIKKLRQTRNKSGFNQTNILKQEARMSRDNNF